MKGETPEEITGAAHGDARARHAAATSIATRLVDTCGTGGDGRGTFNISTVAALVAAAAGANVAKHGNRAVSSACGSADVLDRARREHRSRRARGCRDVLRRTGIAFLFAPKLHPAMGAVAPVRRELGVRTIFNVLGPLTNPAFARRQVLGVYAAELVERRRARAARARRRARHGRPQPRRARRDLRLRADARLRGARRRGPRLRRSSRKRSASRGTDRGDRRRRRRGERRASRCAILAGEATARGATSSRPTPAPRSTSAASAPTLRDGVALARARRSRAGAAMREARRAGERDAKELA